VTLRTSAVRNNTARAQGPDVYAVAGGIEAAQVSLIDSAVSGNTELTADEYHYNTGGCGGVCAQSVYALGSTISHHPPTGGGGGIAAASVTLINSTVSGNYVVGAGQGGGITVGAGFDPNLSLYFSTIVDNRANYGGIGGIVVNVTSGKLHGSLIFGNSTLD